MNAELSQRVARIMGKASPAPTLEEREEILTALENAQSWGQLPTRIRQMLNYMTRTKGKGLIPGTMDR